MLPLLMSAGVITGQENLANLINNPNPTGQHILAVCHETRQCGMVPQWLQRDLGIKVDDGKAVMFVGQACPTINSAYCYWNDDTVGNPRHELDVGGTFDQTVIWDLVPHGKHTVVTVWRS